MMAHGLGGTKDSGLEPFATALAEAISDSTAIPEEVARIQGIALASVYGLIIREAGLRTREGQGQRQIADEIRPVVERVLEELDAWFRTSRRRAVQRARR